MYPLVSDHHGPARFDADGGHRGARRVVVKGSDSPQSLPAVPPRQPGSRRPGATEPVRGTEIGADVELVLAAPGPRDR